MTVAATSGPILAAPVLREDILVSICFSDLTLSETSFERVRALARCVDARFRFREIILVIDSANHEAYLPLVREVENLRLFALRPGSTYYDRRVIAAEESIGDVVVIANEDEVSELDISGMIAQSAAADSIVLGTRHASDSGRRALWAPVSMLGRAAGFKVNASELQTLAVPRTQLNQLLSHSDPELALRFLPRDPRLLVEFSTARGVIHPVDGPSSIGRRLQIIQKLLIYMAPRLLLFVTIASALLTLLGVGFALYIVGAWVVVDTLAPGWLTTSIMLSMTACFMGIAVLGLSLGMQQLLMQQRKTSLENVAHEVNRIDLFGKVASDLNVDIEQGENVQRGAAQE